MPFYNPSQIDTREIFPGARIRTMWGEHIMVSLVDLDPHSEVPKHSHPNEQAGIVLEGELTMTISREEQTLKKGDVYFIPSDVEHSVTVGERSAQVADLFSPPRDDYKR